jgi:hypothetical protein
MRDRALDRRCIPHGSARACHATGSRSERCSCLCALRAGRVRAIHHFDFGLHRLAVGPQSGVVGLAEELKEIRHLHRGDRARMKPVLHVVCLACSSVAGGCRQWRCGMSRASRERGGQGDDHHRQDSKACATHGPHSASVVVTRHCAGAGALVIRQPDSTIGGLIARVDVPGSRSQVPGAGARADRRANHVRGESAFRSRMQRARRRRTPCR